VATGRYPGPIGTRSECAANSTRSTRATITFLGEQQDIIDPVAAILVAGRMTEHQCSVRQQPVDGNALQVRFERLKSARHLHCISR
jgi:hypothetical protein